MTQELLLVAMLLRYANLSCVIKAECSGGYHSNNGSIEKKNMESSNFFFFGDFIALFPPTGDQKKNENKKNKGDRRGRLLDGGKTRDGHNM